MDSFEWTVAILAAALAVLLVISIVFMSYAIKVIRQLKKVSEQAEKVANNFEVASAFFRKSAAPVAITKLISSLVDMVGNESNDKKSKRKKK